MEDNENLSQLHKALISNWAVSENTELSMHELLEALSLRVQYLYDRDFDKLTTAMYTLDVDESRFNAALDLPELEDKSKAVARLILQREVQKMDTRMLYEEMKRQQSNEKSVETPEIEVRPTNELDTDD